MLTRLFDLVKGNAQLLGDFSRDGLDRRTSFASMLLLLLLLSVDLEEEATVKMGIRVVWCSKSKVGSSR